jgi:hypothetical protein
MRSFIEEFDIEVIEARQITSEELFNPNTFACDVENRTCLDSPYLWIYSTSYWTGTARNEDSVWRVFSDGSFDNNRYLYLYIFHLFKRYAFC